MRLGLHPRKYRADPLIEVESGEAWVGAKADWIAESRVVPSQYLRLKTTLAMLTAAQAATSAAAATASSVANLLLI